MSDPRMDALERLTNVLKERKNASANNSYVASLYQAGLDAILSPMEKPTGPAP